MSGTLAIWRWKQKVLFHFQNKKNMKREPSEEENLDVDLSSPNSTEINAGREFCSTREGLAKTLCSQPPFQP